MSDDERAQDTPQLSESDTSDDDSNPEPIESLVAGRERRKTAGNRYDRETILEEAPAEEDPDEVALLFADNEEEEDEEFKSDEGDDEADMSSSDDDDQGPNAAADDLEGEKEIVKQAKDERSKKRKADLALTSVSGIRKRLKTDPTQPNLPAAKSKPSKKKERITWVHAQASGRSSLRKQTIAHRAETIQRLKESEAQSKKLKALKEKRDRERAEDAPKELTQADRLAEAARTERQNAKSLNRWEATEKKRQEEQAAKLAALKNRKLEGPVVSWWSAKAKWIGPRLNKIGTKDGGDILEGGGDTSGTVVKKKPGRKTKAELERLAAEKMAASNTPVTAQTASMPPPAGVTQPSTESASTAKLPAEIGLPDTKLETSELSQASAATSPTASSTVPGPELIPNPGPTDQPANNKLPEPPKIPGEVSEPPAETPSISGDSFLHGIFEYASMEEDARTSNKSSANEHGPENAPKAESPKPDVPMMDAPADQVKIVPKAVPVTSQDASPNPTPTPDSKPIIVMDTTETSAAASSAPTAPISTAATPTEPTPTEPTPTEPTPTEPTPTEPTPTEPPLTAPKPAEPTSTTPTPTAPTLTAPASEAVSLSDPLRPSTAADATQPPVPTPEPAPGSSIAGNDEVKSEPSKQQAVEIKVDEALPEPVIAYSTRNLVILEKFDGLSSQARQDYSLFYNQRKLGKTVKSLKHSQELCPITALPVRYRDPATGISYATAAAYKKIQELKDYRFAWSSMLGCYVGRDGATAARGVPEGFLQESQPS